MLENAVLNMGAAIEQLLHERVQDCEQFKAFIEAAATAAAPATASVPDQAPPPPQDQEVEPQVGVPTEEEEPQEVHEMDTPATNTRS